MEHIREALSIYYLADTVCHCLHLYRPVAVDSLLKLVAVDSLLELVAIALASKRVSNKSPLQMTGITTLF